MTTIPAPHIPATGRRPGWLGLLFLLTLALLAVLRSHWVRGPQSRSGAPSGKYGRYGRASSTQRLKDGRASRRWR